MDILKVRFRTNSEFEEAYDPEVPGGGLFCPTTSPFEENQEVVVELSAPALPNKVLISGVVQSWRPALPRLRVRAGAVVAFNEDESEKRDFVVQTIRGERGPTRKRRHARLPVDVPIRYRTVDSADFLTSSLTEISIGGCTVKLSETLAVESEVILEVTPPGAVSPISISAQVTHHTDDEGGTGLKFLARDSGGSRRLRELIRRLKQA